MLHEESEDEVNSDDDLAMRLYELDSIEYSKVNPIAKNIAKNSAKNSVDAAGLG